MNPSAAFVVRAADWSADRAALRAVRHAVFVREQSVPEALEWDEFDAASRHGIAEANGAAIGTGRLLPDGHIGRMAVLAPWRGRGVGAALLQWLLDVALLAGHREVRLSAQVHAVGFYRRFGFTANGEPYLEAGIPHVDMQLALASVPPPYRG
jgi:predicted GNAT family N-acyltransferase